MTTVPRAKDVRNEAGTARETKKDGKLPGGRAREAVKEAENKKPAGDLDERVTGGKKGEFYLPAP